MGTNEWCASNLKSQWFDVDIVRCDATAGRAKEN